VKALSRTLLFCMVIVLVGAPGVSRALTLLDNFNSKPIDPDVWFGFQSGDTPDAPIEEVLRGIVPNTITGVGNVLGLLLISYGDTASDAGTQFQQQGLNMQDPAGVTGLKAQVVVHKATVQQCLANPASTGRAAMRMALFNSFSAANAGTGDRTGDVIASFDKVLDPSLFPNSTHVIQAYLFRCKDHDCTGTDKIAGVTFGKHWAFEVFQAMEMEWDNAHSKVVFTVGQGPNAEVQSLDYPQTNMGGPGKDIKGVRLLNEPANCTAGRRGVRMEAGFDNVFTNP
jgi:hypothetical protein